MEDVGPDSTFIDDLKAQALRRVDDDKAGYISRAIGRGQMGQPEKRTEYQPEENPTPWEDLSSTEKYERLWAREMKKEGLLKDNPFGIGENHGYVPTDAKEVRLYEKSLKGDLPLQGLSDWFFAKPDGEGGYGEARPQHIKNMDNYLMFARAYNKKLQEVQNIMDTGGAGLAEAEAELERIKAIAQSASTTPTFVDDPEGTE